MSVCGSVGVSVCVCFVCLCVDRVCAYFSSVCFLGFSDCVSVSFTTGDLRAVRFVQCVQKQGVVT